MTATRPRYKRRCKRVGIMGFKADPPHNYHLRLAELAREEHELDEVLFIPAGQPVDKSSGVTEKLLRLKLTELAVADNPHFKVSRFEVDREGFSYTVDTLRALRMQYGRLARFFLIIGEDRPPTLKNWHQSSTLCRMCKFLVGPRTQGTVDKDWLRAVMPRGARYDTVTVDNSSSFVRAQIAQGRSVRYIVPDALIAEIEQLGLYQS